MVKLVSVPPTWPVRMTRREKFLGRIEDLESVELVRMMGCMRIRILCYVNRGTIYGYNDILNYILIEARLYDTRCYQVR